VNPRRRFGQHFLDGAWAARVLEAAAFAPADHVIEIGPGRGALTVQLAGTVTALTAVEIDRDLVPVLRGRLPRHARVIEGDFLDVPADRLFEGDPDARWRVIGNLPYNVSTPLLFRLLKAVDHIADFHVMLQKEVVDRMAAAPGSDDFGRLTVMLAPRLRIEHLFDVGPGAFSPPPRVWSAVARLTVLPGPRFPVNALFGPLVAAAFSQRRKTLRNSLREMLSPEDFKAAGVDPGARPETLEPRQFAALAALARPRAL
jgi:16S rRNA (adenine1518-N6/adenine1519-N6)-dimethyltransferase